MRFLLPVLLLAACASAEHPPPRGFVVVSMDTLRADATSPYGAPASATPALARFAAESVVFERAYANANETLYSHGSMFTGRIPSTIAPLDYDFTIPDGTATLASRFRDAGYRTAAMVSGGHLGRVFGLTDGFETYAEGPNWGSFQATVPMAMQWLGEITKGDDPFFLFVHGYDAHNPYVKPGLFGRLATPGLTTHFATLMFDPQFFERVRGDAFYPQFSPHSTRNVDGVEVLGASVYSALEEHAENPDNPRVPLSATDIEVIVGSYHSAVSYADAWVGMLLHDLKSRGLLATTTVVVLSDHGEALLEHGFFNHRHTLRNASTHVPLLVRPAKGRSPTRVAAPVSLLDVAPTLLRLAGIEADLPGRSLESCFSGHCADGKLPYSEGATGDASVTDGHFRLVVSGVAPSDPAFDDALRSGEGLSFALYDASYGERTDLAADPKYEEVVASLRAGMLAARGGP